jgi:ribosomal protein S18 acetylase RimI-like enzyme
MWLEVRRSNTTAHAIYTHWGFETVGERKNYYPAGRGQREDAVVMGLAL